MINKNLIIIISAAITVPAILAAMFFGVNYYYGEKPQPDMDKKANSGNNLQAADFEKNQFSGDDYAQALMQIANSPDKDAVDGQEAVTGDGGKEASQSKDSLAGNSKASAPASVQPAAKAPAPVTTAKTPIAQNAVKIPLNTAQGRDLKRKTDMQQLVLAQKIWYAVFAKYYTCSVSGGDCGKLANNFPAAIGNYAKNLVDPLNTGKICGRDQIYCGMDNSAKNQFFCYYAKLEAGGFYTASHNGNFERQTAPTTFGECSSLTNVSDQGIVTNAEKKTTSQERDIKRQLDMQNLLSAQKKYKEIYQRYYTCSSSAGDCGARSNNFPGAIGSAMSQTPADPVNSGGICGSNLIYCGLDNTESVQNFCFYAKLETGGYYTAAPGGNFFRSTPPATFNECAQPN